MGSSVSQFILPISDTPLSFFADWHFGGCNRCAPERTKCRKVSTSDRVLDNGIAAVRRAGWQVFLGRPSDDRDVLRAATHGRFRKAMAHLGGVFEFSRSAGWSRPDHSVAGDATGSDLSATTTVSVPRFSSRNATALAVLIKTAAATCFKVLARIVCFVLVSAKRRAPHPRLRFPALKHHIEGSPPAAHRPPIRPQRLFDGQ